MGLPHILVLNSGSGSGGGGGSTTNNEAVGIVIDAGGDAITSGLKGWITVPYNGTIRAWTVLADQVGSIVIDVWKVTYAGYPGSVANSITNGDKPTLSSVQKNRNPTISAWTVTTITKDDVIEFNVDSASTVTRVMLVLEVLKS